MDSKKWLKTHVFHHREFKNLKPLLSLKERQNLKVSLGLPTLNVAKTLPEILKVIKENLMEKYPLLDEIAIIDGRSKDKTVSLAKRFGVDIYYEDEILPQIPPAQGKGEALWRSLYALKGDIIVFIDSDIENIHPRFVYGLLGPLLKDPQIGYVKGFYKRPLKKKGVLKETGGGRVTEILARPLLNLFYPELSVFIQPLSGEYAGRREVLEKIPFYTGYAVETALLIEILRKFGLESMAQVDLEKRVHYNQPTPALGKMSFAILQAIFPLLEEDKRLKLASKINLLYQRVKSKNGKYFLDGKEIKVLKRPPLVTIPEYRKMRERLKTSQGTED